MRQQGITGVVHAELIALGGEVLAVAGLDGFFGDACHNQTWKSIMNHNLFV